MTYIGHAVQWLHLGMVLTVAYAIGRGWGALVGAWFVAVFVTNKICGACPVTLLSNYFFKLDGSTEYEELVPWMRGALGLERMEIIGPGLFLAGIAAGLVGRCVHRLRVP